MYINPMVLNMLKMRQGMAPNPSDIPMSMLGGNGAASAVANAAGNGMGWGNWAGIGMQALSPVAAAILGRQRQEERPPSLGFTPSTSLGSKPMMQAPVGHYGQMQQAQPILARLLMGGRY